MEKVRNGRAAPGNGEGGGVSSDCAHEWNDTGYLRHRAVDPLSAGAGCTTAVVFASHRPVAASKTGAWSSSQRRDGAGIRSFLGLMRSHSLARDSVAVCELAEGVPPPALLRRRIGTACVVDGLTGDGSPASASRDSSALPGVETDRIGPFLGPK